MQNIAGVVGLKRFTHEDAALDCIHQTPPVSSISLDDRLHRGRDLREIHRNASHVRDACGGAQGWRRVRGNPLLHGSLCLRLDDARPLFGVEHGADEGVHQAETFAGAQAHFPLRVELAEELGDLGFSGKLKIIVLENGLHEILDLTTVPRQHPFLLCIEGVKEAERCPREGTTFDDGCHPRTLATVVRLLLSKRARQLAKPHWNLVQICEAGRRCHRRRWKMLHPVIERGSLPLQPVRTAVTTRTASG
mmetsp:Transcript_35874/g.95250  ORF Transcript_35874/g.95250 Transcript_35874/m.95250 type:complete len:249 (-) Transcript_35874:1125-1871(-)